MPDAADTPAAGSVVPVVDLSMIDGSEADRAVLAHSVDAACREIGFLVLDGHGVDPELLAQVDAVARMFFDLPLSARQACARHQGGMSRGYSAMLSRALARTLGDDGAKGDLRETFTMGSPHIDQDDPYYRGEVADHLFLQNAFPAELPEMQGILKRYYEAMSILGERIMRIFALALGLDEQFFAPLIGRHVSNLTLTNYPSLDAPPEPGQMRAGAHTDYGTLTILRAEDKPGGLEIRGEDEKWRKVPIRPDCFVINIGDLMARWTNDRWRSTLHRVTAPPPGSVDTQRLSIVFFHQPDHNAAIACLPSCVGEGALYPPTTSGAHMLDKMRRSRA